MSNITRRTALERNRKLDFIEDYEKLKPEDQEFVARLLEGLADRVKRDPEADGMPPYDLFREVIEEVAPERLGSGPINGIPILVEM
jgi:hypothetical protein